VTLWKSLSYYCDCSSEFSEVVQVSWNLFYRFWSSWL
jgi:hypothetical protein